MMNAASTEPELTNRCASEYRFVSSSDNLPVSGFRRCILMPDQKLPNASQGLPSASSARFGSMQLYWLIVVDSTTSPSSIHSKSSDFELSVLFVARPMTERLLPNVETE